MMTPGPTLDLCAGPGGWSHAARALGLDEIGIELDPAACATRRAAGHATIRADIAALPVAHLAGKLSGVIGSPPCQGMSIGGLRAGWADFDTVLRLLADLASGRDTRAQLAPVVADPRSLLIAEPLRYALAARPEWVACEQVPAVLPLWEATARHLRAAGYDTWAGLLNAADYGVAQTRKRAILIASRVRPVRRPAPTHSENPAPARVGPEPFPSNARAALRAAQQRGAWKPSATGSVRPAPADAAALQGFPPHYPWQGTKTKVFEQIGNAVPPPLARAVLAAATGREVGA